jgi:chromosome segregation ATPase
MSHRSQSNLSALSLFDKAVSLELHLSGVASCIMQDVAFNNTTMLNDTIADIGDSKSYPRKVIGDVVSALKQSVMDCRAAVAELAKPASKKDSDALAAMTAAISPIIAAYGEIVAPMVNKKPVQKTDTEKAEAKAKAAEAFAEKAKAWAIENGYTTPENIAKVSAEVLQAEEVKHLQTLLDESRAETAAIATKLAESVQARAALHADNATLRAQVETATAKVEALSAKLDAIRAMPRASKALLALIA